MPSEARKPLIVGIGGTLRPGSTSELALALCMSEAAALGAEVLLLGGAFLAGLPVFDPRDAAPAPAQLQLCDAVRRADGVVIGTPGYHGSLSGVMKNALDTLEYTSRDAVPYFQDRPVGCVVTAAGPQAAGTTLMSLRTIVHALRGWPTPFGAALNAATPLFDEAGAAHEPKDQAQLAVVARQVVDFAYMRINSPTS